MEMTTPVFTRKVRSVGEKMDMTTPVITTRVRISPLHVSSSFVDTNLYEVYLTYKSSNSYLRVPLSSLSL